MVRQNEMLTISDLSTQPSQQHQTCTGKDSNDYMQQSQITWPSLEEKAFMEKEAMVNQIKHYVKNGLFH